MRKMISSSMPNRVTSSLARISLKRVPCQKETSGGEFLALVRVVVVLAMSYISGLLVKNYFSLA
jgi:hypothetical protein